MAWPHRTGTLRLVQQPLLWSKIWEKTKGVRIWVCTGSLPGRSLFWVSLTNKFRVVPWDLDLEKALSWTNLSGDYFRLENRRDTTTPSGMTRFEVRSWSKSLLPSPNSEIYHAQPAVVTTIVTLPGRSLALNHPTSSIIKPITIFPVAWVCFLIPRRICPIYICNTILHTARNTHLCIYSVAFRPWY